MDATSKFQKSAGTSGFSRGFREAHEKKPTGLAAAVAAAAVPLPMAMLHDGTSTAITTGGKQKKKSSGWAGFSGFFRRNKTTTTAAKKSSSSDDSADERRPPPASHQHPQAQPQQQMRMLQPPRPLPKDRQSPAGFLAPSDSLSPLTSDLSSSTASLSRKERREAILARAQARRQDGDAGSSSDEQDVRSGPSPSPGQQRHSTRRNHHNSQESLTSSTGRSRSSRTERYLQRRSRDEESFRSASLMSVSNPAASPKYWPPMSPPAAAVGSGSGSSWGVVGFRHPEPTSPRLVVGESPVMLRKPGSYNNINITHNNHHNNNNLSSPPERVQSALVTHGKLVVHPPPPPPRNPLKKSYLLQSNDPTAQQQQQQQHHLAMPQQNPCRPTSFSFGELRFNSAQQQRLPYNPHDYQNVDQDGRLILVDTRVSSPTVQSIPSTTCLTSPVQRRVVNGTGQTAPFYSPQSRHHSAFFPAVPSKSPSSSSPFLHQQQVQQQTEQQQERPRPPWLAGKSVNSPVSPTAPVREFWRSKDSVRAQQSQQQQAPPPTPPKPSARERLSLNPFHLAGNGSITSLNSSSNLSSPKDTVAAAAAVTSTPLTGGAPRSFVSTAGSPAQSVNGPRVTPKRNQNGNDNNTNNNKAQPRQQQQQHPVRELSQLRPSTDRHLEQAICELEDIYRSLKLDGDEDLLDRAERRDLPTPHQELLNRSSLYSGSESGGDPLHGPGITSDLDTMMNWSISGSFESLNTTATTTPGSTSGRTRAPPRRRSAVPDKVADDMAVRRLAVRRKSETKEYESGSYLLVTPSMAAAEEQLSSHSNSNSNSNSRSGSGSQSEPDIVLDDVAVRQVRAASLSMKKKVLDPQPPFGIPNVLLKPVSPAPPTDYLHVNVTAEQKGLRPLLHPTKYPDLVRDDLAYRQLRKDAGHSHLVNTEKLDDLLRETNNARSLRQKRAVRSLSANIGQLIIMDAARPSGGGGVVDFNRNNRNGDDDGEEEDPRYIDPNPFDTRAQSLSDLLNDDVLDSSYDVLAGFNNNNYVKPAAKTPRAVKQRSGLKRVTKSCEVEHPELVSITRQMRPEPSWVERAHLSDLPDKTETAVITAEVNRVPGLAKLYPKSALLLPSSSTGGGSQKQLSAAEEMDHLISDLSEFAASSGTSSWKSTKTEVDSSVSSGGGGHLSLPTPPPTGTAASGASPGPAAEVEAHEWEESPLFQSGPQFNFNRSASPANSTDSGQVSCCAREVRQILQQQRSSSSSGEVVDAVPPDCPAARHDDVACTNSQTGLPSLILPADSDAWMHDLLLIDCTIRTKADNPSPSPSQPPPCPLPAKSPASTHVPVDTTDDGLTVDSSGSDDGIDSLPAMSCDRVSSARSSPEEWSNSSRQLSSDEEEEDDDDDGTEEKADKAVVVLPPVLEKTTARWLQVPLERKKAAAAATTTGDGPAGARWLMVAQQVFYAGCVLTSLLTLCGSDLTTCAHLLLALLALAAVFCEMP